MTRYFKLSGSGNDFLALAEPETEPTVGEISGWCARGISAGADGLFVLRRSESGVSMDYFNSDGKRAALCLNGTRCAARLAFHLRWAEETIRVETDAGSFEAREVGGDQVAVRVPAPDGPLRHLRLTQADRVWDSWQIDVGVPHLVIFWDRPMSEAPVASAAPVLRQHPTLGEAGANVDFARFVDRHRLEIRSFERGVEAETLACGTGVLASIAVGIAHGRTELPVTALTRSGFEVRIDTAKSDPQHWLMVADARLVASGELAEGAVVHLEAPAW